MFIRGYTTKQWQKSPRELDAAIIKRLPVREVENDNYYRHRYQGIPPHGYTDMFRTMLAGAEVRLGVDYFEARDYWNAFARKVVFTGEIDRFFDYRHGRLEWRSLRFVRDSYEVKDKQGHAVINFTDDKVPHTRSVEYRHFAPQHTGHIPVTHVVREYPANVSDTGEVYYPVPTSGNRKTFQQYHAMSLELKRRIIFGGRPANYVYIDMAPTIRMALNAARREAEIGTEAVSTNQA
jgi:UDP-galactopyranose mutase